MYMLQASQAIGIQEHGTSVGFGSLLCVQSGLVYLVLLSSKGTTLHTELCTMNIVERLFYYHI